LKLLLIILTIDFGAQCLGRCGILDSADRKERGVGRWLLLIWLFQSMTGLQLMLAVSFYKSGWQPENFGLAFTENIRATSEGFINTPGMRSYCLRSAPTALAWLFEQSRIQNAL